MGSIPVCTGLPPADALRPYSGWVYPRVYGATKIVSYVPSSVKGLSPCVRGYRVFRRRVPGDRGSIPVCTGLPGPDHRRSAAWRVYPRVYGATMHWPVYICGCMGLSPCVRGYLLRPPPTRTAWGSIPVCTGLPGSGCLKRHERRVYPRVYGATIRSDLRMLRIAGLSPCVRGYLYRCHEKISSKGSIPVCTGLPTWKAPSIRTGKVYPRVYGATWSAIAAVDWLKGLSPCVRGYLFVAVIEGEREGSIPVCTGLPRASPRRSPAAWVYPRVYGATERLPDELLDTEGLSPCVRGYREDVGPARHRQGSIPVCTGLPGSLG